MDDLVQFLRARLDEDEARARRAIDGPRTAFVSADEDIEPLLFDEDGVFVLPARVLREVDAKRQILEECEDADRRSNWPDFDGGVFSGLDTAVQHLALPYADHPDYREEWRP